jgi:hypothetical protein
MDKAPRLTAEHRDDLVAYLDGELEESRSGQIDQVLARSEVARHEVEALARTWELLDVLPRVAAPADFADTTMTSLRVAEARTPITEQAWFEYVRRTGVVAVWAAALLGSAAVGFQITSRWVPNPNEEMLRDLPLLEKLHQYQDVEDVEFLRQLQKINAFAEPAPHGDGK